MNSHGTTLTFLRAREKEKRKEEKEEMARKIAYRIVNVGWRKVLFTTLGCGKNKRVLNSDQCSRLSRGVPSKKEKPKKRGGGSSLRAKNFHRRLEKGFHKKVNVKRRNNFTP